MLVLLSFGDFLDIKPPVKAELSDVAVTHLGCHLALLLQLQSVWYVVSTGRSYQIDRYVYQRTASQSQGTNSLTISTTLLRANLTIFSSQKTISIKILCIYDISSGLSLGLGLGLGLGLNLLIYILIFIKTFSFPRVIESKAYVSLSTEDFKLFMQLKVF